MEQIKRFFKEEEGLELTEYAVMAALIVAGIIGVIAALGDEISAKFQELTTSIAAGR
jgi:Flp pilus assembly pilin Flp